MKTVTIDIADSIYEKLEAQSRHTNRATADLIKEVIACYAERGERLSSAHSVLEISSFPLGPPFKPWTTRAEMLEGFMDDRG
jgi:hypothetical protein